MKSIVALQARTTSTRLPGKILLPVSGFPLVILAALRAANTGRRVIVATSDEPSDDALATILQSHQIDCFRGSLNDVLGRIVAALSDQDDSTLVFRLTADNVFPDGNLLDEMEHEFLENELEYLCCNGEPCGLPHGVSAELTRLAHLRDADENSQSSFDREHVTPYVIRKHGSSHFTRHKNAGWGHLRSTIDCLDDYLRVHRVFTKLADPVDIAMWKLVELLEVDPVYPLAETAPAPRMVLGTAQLGMVHGIANTAGQPSSELAEQLIKTAISNGIANLDTARAYGTSENVLGNVLRSGWQGRPTIITKLDTLSRCPATANAEVVSAFVDASIHHSCAALQVQKLQVLLLHRASHLSDWSGAVLERLKYLKHAGVIERLGVSVQNPDELLNALEYPEIEWIQIPLNILDWRWDCIGVQVQNARASRPIVVHARSALLQGLLTSRHPSHWAIANVSDPSELIEWLDAQSRACNRDSVAELALNYVNSIDWIDGIVVGVETLNQLLDDIRMMSLPRLSESQMRNIAATRPDVAETTLDPSRWVKR